MDLIWSRESDYLLRSEIMSHKVLLQFLVGVVDAQLLQVIYVETLEPVDI